MALDGQPGLHDPSTVIAAKGKYYVYATGNGLPVSISDDGWTWRRAGGVMQAVPGGKPGPDVIARGGNNTWAPDVIHVGDKYFLYYAAPGTQPKAAIGLLVGKTLDPDSPDYDGRTRAQSSGPTGRGQQRHRSGRVPRSDQRHAVADLRLLFRLHPAGRTRPEDRQAPLSRAEAGQCRDQFAKRRS